jgi:hypothetical protein
LFLPDQPQHPRRQNRTAPHAKAMPMSTDELIPSLMLFTLFAGLIIALVLLLRFLRKPQNRHPMAGKEERNYEQMREDAGDNPRI